MPLKTEIPLGSVHADWLLEIVVECTDEDGSGPEAVYDNKFEEGKKICDPKDFELGYDGVHWCLVYTKEAFVDAWYKVKEDWYKRLVAPDSDVSEDAGVAE